MTAPFDLLARLDELEALARAATPGPWVAEPKTAAGNVWVQRKPTQHGALKDCEPLFSVRDEQSYKQREADARFIAAAREAVPFLCRELRTHAAVTEAASKIPPKFRSAALNAALARLAPAHSEQEENE